MLSALWTFPSLRLQPWEGKREWVVLHTATVHSHRHPCMSSSYSIPSMVACSFTVKHFRCILISLFWDVEILLHLNLAFSQCSTSIYQAFDGQTEFLRVLNFAILSCSRNSQKFDACKKCFTVDLGFGSCFLCFSACFFVAPLLRKTGWKAQKSLKSRDTKTRTDIKNPARSNLVIFL